MEYSIEETPFGKAAKITALETPIADMQQALDVLVSVLYTTDVDRIWLQASQLDTSFFDLRTGLAGDILQKFSNYRAFLIIEGDFEHVESTALRDFIRESNAAGRIRFVGPTLTP